MNTYPVHYSVDKPAQFDRLQLVIRILALVVLGILGLSLGLLFWVAYLALPVIAAVRLSNGRDPVDYLERDGPRILRALRWFAAIYAWFGLVSDKLPHRSPDETVRVEIERSGQPTPASALVRLFFGLPSMLVLGLLGLIGWLVWIWSALMVLVEKRVGDGAHAFLAGLQRWTIRLLAYQAALVEDYPPFSFQDSPPPQLPAGPVAPT